MQSVGRELTRQRAIATAAGMAIVALGFGVAVLLWVVWPFARIPIWLLAAPVAVSIGVAWPVRNRLWPRGQFS